jgi:hypothetical protein
MQAITQLNASILIGNQGEGQGGNRVGHGASDEESTKHQQRKAWQLGTYRGVNVHFLKTCRTHNLEGAC